MAWRAGAERLGANDDLQLLHRVLRRQLAAALPTGADGNADAALVFTGRNDRLSFVGPAPAQGMARGLYGYTIRLRRDGRSSALALEWRNLAGGGAGVEPLVRRVAGLRIDYLDRSDAEGPPRWSPEWVGRNDLPRAVRIAVRFTGPDPRPWPPLILAVPARAG